MRTTYTYVTMDVSARTYAEIRAKMVDAGYIHALQQEAGSEAIDMHGLALKSLPAPPRRGHLMVGVSERGDEVVVNHPDLVTDADGIGHIVFSADEARGLAELLLKNAEAARANLRRRTS